MRVLVVTAVAAERDAVVAAFADPADPAVAVTPLAGTWELHHVGALAVLAAGVGPAAAAAGTATALALAPAAPRFGAPFPPDPGGKPPVPGLRGELAEPGAATPHDAGEPSPGGRPPGAMPGLRGEAAGPEPGVPPAYDLVVSAGIGGGFAGVAALEGLVVASSIVAADLGVRTADGFTDVAELGFGRVAHEPPAALARAAADAAGAALGPVLTVATVTGTAERAAELAARHPGAAAEGMEGFGVAEAAAAHGVPVLEVRAISNPVGPRDRAAWRIPAALRALTGAFVRIEPVLRTVSGGTDHGTDRR
ncbi:futalosine hydrolase [Streptomyces sp. B6B3]|uniref:futalosine hydrolase n=1 Tax=Streptomyces sp. B6B3 TaxID=3153570 RepID=UPI00325EE7D9